MTRQKSADLRIDRAVALPEVGAGASRSREDVRDQAGRRVDRDVPDVVAFAVPGRWLWVEVLLIQIRVFTFGCPPAWVELGVIKNSLIGAFASAAGAVRGPRPDRIAAAPTNTAARLCILSPASSLLSHGSCSPAPFFLWRWSLPLALRYFSFSASSLSWWPWSRCRPLRGSRRW